jgi:mono/diheme cytochrome c family protein
MRLTLLLTLSAALFLPACDKEEDDDDGGGNTIDPARIDAILALPGDAGAGETVFGRCAAAACHGADGNSGSTGAPLRDEVPGLSDERLIEIVLGGYETMAPQNLSDQEMADVLVYLRDTFG